MSVLLGTSMEDVTAALPEGFETRTGELAGKLRDPRRAVRAQGLALVAREVSLVVAEVTLR